MYTTITKLSLFKCTGTYSQIASLMHAFNSNLYDWPSEINDSGFKIFKNQQKANPKYKIGIH